MALSDARIVAHRCIEVAAMSVPGVFDRTTTGERRQIVDAIAGQLEAWVFSRRLDIEREERRVLGEFAGFSIDPKEAA